MSWQLGMAVASGVPMLILLSLGPVAALAGPPSVVVWALAALIGLAMAVAASPSSSACFPIRPEGSP